MGSSVDVNPRNQINEKLPNEHVEQPEDKLTGDVTKHRKSSIRNSQSGAVSLSVGSGSRDPAGEKLQCIYELNNRRIAVHSSGSSYSGVYLSRRFDYAKSRGHYHSCGRQLFYACQSKGEYS